MNKSSIPIIFFLLLTYIFVEAQEFTIPLYNGPVPNSKNTGQAEIIEKNEIISIRNVQVPEIAVYLPARKFATGQAVIICPGGGYHILCYDYEGTNIARYFNSIGIAGIVLKYRLPIYGNTLEPHKAPLMDAQRAIRLVRSNSSAWNIDPGKIGIMGFSAGGHLASCTGTHFDYGRNDSDDPVERISCRPDFMILVYPVITFSDPVAHRGSREALLGKNADPELVKYYSSELQVQKDTPQAFLVHGDNDSVVPVSHSLLMYQALHNRKIPAELHIITEGEHGFGLAVDNDHPAAWTNNLEQWLKWLNRNRN